VRARTVIINVRGLVKSAGGRLPSCSTESFAERTKAAIPVSLREVSLPLLKQIGLLTGQIDLMDRSTPRVSTALTWECFSTEKSWAFSPPKAMKAAPVQQRCPRVRFSLRKPHSVDQSHGSRQEIRGTAAGGSAVSACLATPLKPNAITTPEVAFLSMATRNSFKGFSILVPRMHYGRILP
jgi:hypothetical protein